MDIEELNKLPIGTELLFTYESNIPPTRGVITELVYAGIYTPRVKWDDTKEGQSNAYDPNNVTLYKPLKPNKIRTKSWTLK